MASELQSQLNVIRKQNIQATPLHQGRASLFLSPQEAAAVDTRAIYDAALSGLSTLRQYDGRFESFFEGILHPSSIEIQRELKTKEENNKLDIEIAQLLKLLALFAHEKSAHLVLEYLIRRFRIHEVNADLLLRAMLVTHDTKIFAKVVQLCTIEGTVWEFVSGAKSNKVPLPRSVIVSKALKNGAVLELLCQIAKSALDTATAQSLTSSTGQSQAVVRGANQILSFFTATVVEMAEERSFDDPNMRHIYPFLLEGLKNKASRDIVGAGKHGGELVEEWRRAACMILMQLCRKTSFAKKLVVALSSSLAEAFNQCVLAAGGKAKSSKLCAEVVSTIAVLAQHQKISASTLFLHKVFAAEEGGLGKEFVAALKRMSASYDISPLSATISQALTSELLEWRANKDAEALNPAAIADVIAALVSNELVDSPVVRALLQKLLDASCNAKSAMYTFPEVLAAVHSVIRHASQLNAVDFDWSIQEATRNAADAGGDAEDKSALLSTFLHGVFSDKQYKMPDGAGVGLLLSLSSTVPQIRLQALKTFSTAVPIDSESTLDVVGLCEAAARNLSEHDDAVATAAWNSNVMVRLSRHLSADTLLEAVQAAALFWVARSSEQPKAGSAVLSVILRALQEKSVLDALHSAGGSSFSTWLFSMVVDLALGGVRVRFQRKPEQTGALFQHSFLALEQEALVTAAAVGAQVPLLKGLKAVSEDDRKKLTTDLVFSSVVDAVAKNLNDAHFSFLKELIDCAQVSGSLNVLRLVTAVLSKLVIKKSAADQRLLGKSLTALCPLLLSSIHTVDSQDSASPVESAQLLASLNDFIALAAQSAPAATPASSLAQLINSVSHPIKSSDIGGRLLVQLLASKQSSLKAVVGPCLSAFCPATAGEKLLQVALTVNGDLAVSPVHNNAGPDSVVFVTASARYSALQALAAYVVSINTRGDASAKHHLTVSDSCFLLALVPVVVAACGEPKELIRKAGLSVAKRIAQLHSKCVLTLDHDAKARLAKLHGTSATLSLEDLLVLSQVLVNREGVIALDSFAAASSLVSEIFGADSTANHHHSKYVQKMCFFLATEYGWSAPSLASAVVNISSASSLEDTWSFVHHMLSTAATAPDSAVDLAEALVRCLLTFPSCSEATQSRVAQWIVAFVSSASSGVESKVVQRIRDSVVGLFAQNVFVACDEKTKKALYSALVQEQLAHPGRPDVVAAIASFSLNVFVPLQLLKEGLAAFATSFHKVVTDSRRSSSTAMDIVVDASDLVSRDEDLDDNVQLVGMSAPLQRLNALLDAVIPSVRSASGVEAAELGLIAGLLLDCLSLINHPSLKTVMIVEFSKALLIDAAFHCVSVAGKDMVSAQSVAAEGKSKTPSKKNVASKSSTTSQVTVDGVTYDKYTTERVEGDINVLLACLGSAKISQVQNSALNLLQALIVLNPTTILPSIRVLGELLSTSAAAVQLGREGLVENILRAFIALMPKDGSSCADLKYLSQDIFQSLCERFQFMPHYRRSALTKMALKTLGDEASVAAAINILLTHTFTSYEAESNSSNVAVNTLASSDAKGTNFQPLLLLSKAAHRKANKELKASVAEEFFSLAVDILVNRSPEAQIKTIVTLLRTTHQLLEKALSQGAAGDAEDVSTLPVSLPKVEAYCVHLLDLKSKLSVAPANGASVKSAKVVDSDKRGHAATLAVLHLEYILEVLEHKQLHQLLVNYIDQHQAGASGVQDLFLEFADFVLQLQTFATAVEQGYGTVNQTFEVITVRLEASTLRLSPKALSSQVNSWCYESLKVVQRIVDAPTFVTILQELISHDSIEVRQRALLILGERLEGMSASKSKVEVSLYLDLNSSLRRIVADLVPTLRSPGKQKASSTEANKHQLVGLAQSALMCIDVLARFLGKREEWLADLTSTLGEVVELVTLLTKLVDPHAKGSSVEAVVEHMKLLGSAFLCCGTLCGVLGPKSLNVLSTLMASELGNLETQGQCLLQHVAVDSDDEGGEDSEAQLLHRTRTLFVRSVISSLAILATDLSSFFHPYIKRTLLLALPLHGVAHLGDIERDVDRCLSAIASKIPPRLSVPTLLETTPLILRTGHNSASRFAELLAEVWLNLDRATVVAHMHSLSTMATLLLDYRRVYGDQTEAGDDVDATVADAVVELSLKLTESELKTFLTRLAEWRDVQVDSDLGVKKYARSVSFYSLVEALCEKLKGLFVPSMAMLWSNAAALVGEFSQVVASAGKTQQVASKKKDKKRSAEEFTEDVSAPSAEAEARSVVEVTALVRRILSCVKVCCDNDTTNFIDEQRYEAMMPSVVSLLPLRSAFVSDDAYLAFTEESVTPALTALAVAIGKDLLWKPLNHKVLHATRDKRKAVRMAAVKTLHQLFSEVGEEYLLLMPECLPFLSELMEDDTREVTSLTQDCIRFLEDLSGEKLDTYLQ